MNNVPDCCYEYRYQGETLEIKVVDTCLDCQCNIYEGDTYYNIDGTILCDECIGNYRKEG